MPNRVNDESDFTVQIKIELLYAWLFILFIFSWISVELVARAINNFTFNTLGLSEKSTFHTTIIALVVVIIQLVTLKYFRILNIVDDTSIDNISSSFGINNNVNNVNNNISYNRNFMHTDHIGLIPQLEEIAII